jgi:hypothetical protein
MLRGPIWRGALGVVCLLGVTSCATVVGLEPTVPYESGKTGPFPACSAAKNAFVCSEAPDPGSWGASPVNDRGSCKRERAPGRRGDGLRVSCDATSNAADVPDPDFCAASSFSQSAGFRLRLAFRLDTSPTHRSLAVLEVLLPNDASLTVRVASGALTVMAFDAAEKQLPLAEPVLGPADPDWHEIEVDVPPDGKTTLVFDGKVPKSAIDLGEPGDGTVYVSVLDSGSADHAAAVTIDDVIVIPR